MTAHPTIKHFLNPSNTGHAQAHLAPITLTICDHFNRLATSKEARP